MAIVYLNAKQIIMVKITSFCFFLLGLILFSSNVSAQTNRFSVGTHLEWSMEAPSYSKLYSINGKYDLSDRQAVQAQFGLGTYDIIYFGADYLYNVFLFNKKPSVFLAAGLGYEAIRGTKANDIIINAQVGLEYEINKFSPFVGYKPKYYFEAEGIDPSTIMIGVRYRL